MNEPKVQVDSLNCPKCGGALVIQKGEEQVKCNYCGNSLVISRTDTNDIPLSNDISEKNIDDLFNL